MVEQVDGHMIPEEGAPIHGMDDLVSALAAGERQTTGFGVETERLPLDPVSGRARPYQGPGGVREALDALEGCGWQPEVITGGDSRLVTDDGTITLEPGGQLEFSGAVVSDVHAAVAQLEQERAQLLEATRGVGIAWGGLGFHPISPVDDISWAEKARYEVMRPYLGSRGRLAHSMMKGTATVQLNLDFSSEADLSEKFRLASRITPLLVALFANSPLREGQPNGALSYRSLIWRETDSDRCGLVPKSMEDGFGYRDYVDWLLDVPMFFIERGGRYRSMVGRTFRDYMAKGADGEVATLADWDLHQSTVFPEVRIRGPLEVRAADAQRPGFARTFIALCGGLFYSGGAREAALALTAEWSTEEIHALLVDAARLGPEAQIRGREIRGILAELIRIARAGLVDRDVRDGDGRTEAVHLEPIEELFLERGLVPAQEVLASWDGEWARNPAHLVAHCSAFRS